MMTEGLLMGVENPVSPLSYKRAVLKSAPREFTVEVLCPTKQGNHFSYGVKVCPIIRSRSSSDSRSTASSYSEYEIWRRWEDCLDFQEILENEYGKMSRQKVKDLKRGKKRNEELDGPYSLPKAAASFDSLPEGPDPREIAVDVHQLIPPLNRKGSLFRVSRSTIKQRGDEFAAMIQALFNPSEDAPVLLQELRNCSSVRDFFGIWRRDKDLLKKSGKDVSRLRHSNHSMSSLSTSFSFSTASTSSTTPSSPASMMFPPTPTSPGALSRHSMFARGPTNCHRDTPTPTSAPAGSHRFLANSYVSNGDLRTSAADSGSGSFMFTDELLLQDESASPVRSVSRPHMQRSASLYGHPEVPSQPSHPSNSRVQYSIPEELSRPQPRTRSNSATAPGYRNARLFVAAPNSSVPLEVTGYSSHQPKLNGTPNSPSGSAPPARQASHTSAAPSHSSSYSPSVSSYPSSMSMDRFSTSSSISSYTEASKRSSRYSDFSYDSESCIDLDLACSTSTLLPEAAGSGHRPRDSTSSFASFRTDASADGVLPRHLRYHAESPRGARSHSSTPVDETRTRTSFEPVSEGDEDDLLDAYFTGAKFSMESLDKELPRFISHGGKESISSISSVGSQNSSGEPPLPWSPRDDAFAVKAVYNESVIVFRAERSMSLANIQQRIKDRFAVHESVLLEHFFLAYVPSWTPTVNGMGQRKRSSSVTSSTSDVSQLRLLRTEVDWQAAMATCNGKVTLRVLDAGL